MNFALRDVCSSVVEHLAECKPLDSVPPPSAGNPATVVKIEETSKPYPVTPSHSSLWMRGKYLLSSIHEESSLSRE